MKRKITAGIPQWSVLGTVLCTTFTSCVCRATVATCADGTAFISSIS